jgi:hypothetical protein
MVFAVALVFPRIVPRSLQKWIGSYSVPVPWRIPPPLCVQRRSSVFNSRNDVKQQPLRALSSEPKEQHTSEKNGGE